MAARRLGRALPLLAALVMAGAGCGEDGSAAGQPPARLRLGYFPNITHASAIVGVQEGIFQEELGNTRLEPQTFNAGPAAVEALLSGALDATYIGPNPAINAFAQSDGEAIRVVSGATSGGAFLVVGPGIDDPGDLRGKKLASPQLGGTQDVALRHWLTEQGLENDLQGGGDVSIVPQENAQTLETFRSDAIDGAWVPEPWATRLVQEAGARVLVDEADLWPEGRFATTYLVVRADFLGRHPDAVRALLRGQVRANAVVNDEPSQAQRIVNDGMEAVTGKRLADVVITAAWENLEFTNDPVASSLSASAEHARAVGLLEDVDLEGIYALDLLNQVLEAGGEPTVEAV